MNYKQNDMFQVENEEMVCGDVPVDYELLDNFFGKLMAPILDLRFYLFLP